MRIVIIAVIIVAGCVGLFAEPNVEKAVINSDALHLVDVMTAEYKERLMKMLSDMPAEKQLQWIEQTKRSRENRQKYKADYELLNPDEAMKFVSSCLLKIKHKDKSVLKVLTDANILCDVEKELAELGETELDWNKLFGDFSSFSDEQLKAFNFMFSGFHGSIGGPMRITDKRGGTVRMTEGIYRSITANVKREYEPAFNDSDEVHFGVYVIDGEFYWEPFNW